MSWFDKIFRRGPKKTIIAPTLNGWLPMYGQYMDFNVYSSDMVQQVLSCIVNEMKKLRPMHIRNSENFNDPVPVKGNIQDILNNPNPLMTTSDFLEKIVWLLLLNSNVFILPIYSTWTDQKTGEERRYYEALYPLKPTQVDFLQDEGGNLYVKFYFANGTNTTIPYENVIHIKYKYMLNDFMGGNELGQPDNEAIKQTLQMNEHLLKSIAKAMDASYQVNGVVKFNTMLDNGDTEAALKELERKLNNSESGFLPLDLKAEFTPLERKAEIVDADTLKFIDEKILRFWGVPLAILTGDYTKVQYEAFYQKVLEPLIISISQEFTKKIFTTRQRAFGNKVELYPKDLIFMTMEQTLSMIEILAPTGALFENEKRVALGLRPMAELEGKRFQSLNWVNAEDASKYQLGKVNVDIVDENKTVTEE
jgi:HK97 family phage portal protein